MTHRSTEACPSTLAPLLLALFALACGPGGDRTEPYDESRPRSVVLIVVDTLRADRVHEGADALRMAAARRLAEDGVDFSRAFSHASMTLPSHTALLSGLHPYATGVLSNGDSISEGLELVPDWLLERGYQTTAIASIRAISSHNLLRNFEHVVDVSEGGLASAEESLQHMEQALDRLEPERPFFLLAHFSDPHAPYRAHEDLGAVAEVTLRGEPIESFDLANPETSIRTVELLPGEQLLEFTSDEPFQMGFVNAPVQGSLQPLERVDPADGSVSTRFAYRLFNPKDEPVQLELRYRASDAPNAAQRRLRYDAEVAFVDDHVQRLLDSLEQRGLYDDSLIVFTSDHGEGLGEHDFENHAARIWDEQLHVPLVIKPPSGFPFTDRLRASADQLVRHIDVTATMLQILRLPPAPDSRGISLLEQSEERLLVAQTHGPLIDKDFLCLRDDEYKLIYDVSEDSFEMFAIDVDPDEEHDVFAQRRTERPDWPGILRELALVAEQSRSSGGPDPESRLRLQELGY